MSAFLPIPKWLLFLVHVCFPLQAGLGCTQRRGHHVGAVKRFRYVLDPLCLGSCLLYALNRWCIKAFTDWSFFHNTFNDLLLIPAALPLLLLVQRWLSLRRSDTAPSFSEIVGHWLVWSLLSEVLLPLFSSRITGDPFDVLAYAAGACFAGLWWGWFYSSRTDFDWIASYYGWIETFAAGELMQKSRTPFLSSLSGNILLAGEGNGRCLEALLRLNHRLEITCLDQSEKMLALARRRLQRAGFSGASVTYLCQDIRKIELPANSYDGIITPYFLDCFDGVELDEVVTKLASAGKVRCHWVVADFQIPESGAGRYRAKLVVWLLIRFFRVVTGLRAASLQNPAESLNRAGFVRRQHLEFDGGLVYADLWERG
ncbi:MAG: class I SAM-dependent methyltransferase [Blastochloris sp.]|nr:class I SAM-dependent methyltransferase [Blastochloris sp.]